MATKKKEEKGIDLTTSNYLNQEVSEEKFLIGMAAQIASRLKKDYGYSDHEVFEFCIKEKESALIVPMQIFASELAPSEALIKYLKETFGLNYHEISELIKRNERSVWASYQRASKKMHVKFDIKEPIAIPISIFQNEKLSILECVIVYLKDTKNLKGVKIAKLLNKHPANIWTVYNNAKVKLGEKGK